MQLEAKNLNDAIAQIQFFKKYKPFKYGGKWVLAEIDKQWFAFRTKKPLITRAINSGKTDRFQAYEVIL